MSNINSISVSLSKSSLSVGERCTACVQVSPSNAEYSVDWRSGDSWVASVSPLGVVYANCPGTTGIHAFVTDACGNELHAYAWITVTGSCSGSDTGTETTTIPVESVTVCPHYKEMKVGQTDILEATVCPENATDKRLTWYSRDTSVAIVNPNTGLVSAVGVGSAVIVAESVDGSEKRGGCTVVVEKAVPATSVTVCPKRKTLGMHDIAILHATVCPCEAAVNPVKWFSSNPSVATVGTYTGIVTPVSSGTTTITALVANGSVTDTCTITVDFRERVTVTGSAGETTVQFSNGAIWQMGSSENVTKVFSEQQLAFLYLLDPLGVENFMNNYYRNPGYSMQDYLFFKDRVYQEIFGVKPFLFRVMPSGNLQYYDYPDNLSYEVRKDMHSYAEMMFGAHVIFDNLAVANFVTDVLVTVFSELPYVSDVLSYVELCQALFFSGAINGIVSGGASDFIDDYVNDTFGSTVGDMFGWAKTVISVMSGIVDAAEDAFMPPNPNDITIYHKISSQNYCTNFVVNGGEMSMEDIISAYTNN